MIKFLRDKSPVIFAFLFFISVLPFLSKLSKEPSENVVKKDELYNPRLNHVNSIDKAVIYVDSLYSARFDSVYNGRAQTPGVLDTALYVHSTSRFSKERFYHGISHYSFSENWIAFVAGKLLWSHLSAIVAPNDIIKHSEGLCSQQTIVFMELLKRKKINVRSIGLGYKEGPGHFLCEVYYNGSWRIYDITMEPKWKKLVNRHESMEYYLANKDSLYLVYESRLKKDLFDKITEKVVYGKINEFPASNMLLFHQFTFLLTYLLPFIFMLLFVRSYSKMKKAKVKIPIVEEPKVKDIVFEHST